LKDVTGQKEFGKHAGLLVFFLPHGLLHNVSEDGQDVLNLWLGIF
jgi:hypothetical protein